MRSHLRQASDTFTPAGDGRVPPQAALQESDPAAVTVRQFLVGFPLRPTRLCARDWLCRASAQHMGWEQQFCTAAVQCLA